MITLYVFGPNFGLPETSPYVTKTEVQLKMAGLRLPQTDAAACRSRPRASCPSSTTTAS